MDLLLFTGPGPNEPYCEAARKILGSLAALSEKIGFREFDIKHELAAKYQIEYTPTLIIDPDHVHIHWLGAPLGREIEPFFQAVNMVGRQQTGLGDQALKVLKSIDEPRQIKIFVSLTCPYCPQQVRERPAGRRGTAGHHPPGNHRRRGRAGIGRKVQRLQHPDRVCQRETNRQGGTTRRIIHDQP